MLNVKPTEMHKGSSVMEGHDVIRLSTVTFAVLKEVGYDSRLGTRKKEVTSRVRMKEFRVDVW